MKMAQNDEVAGVDCSCVMMNYSAASAAAAAAAAVAVAAYIVQPYRWTLVTDWHFAAVLDLQREAVVCLRVYILF